MIDRRFVAIGYFGHQNIMVSFAPQCCPATAIAIASKAADVRCGYESPMDEFRYVKITGFYEPERY